uniref:ATP-dependent DNA helicase RecG n=1 Tax=candidate division WOR-3 bacterium TaxID=2052148 RepID=A0A7C2P6N9_UNCW3
MGKQKPVEISLDTPVQYVKGVGPQRAQLLKKLDILTVYDLLYFAPRRYEDRTQITKISQLTPNTNCTVRGYVVLIGPRKMIGKEGASIIIEDESGWVEVFWTIPEIAKRFSVGDEVIISGRVSQDKFSGKMVFIHPEYAIVGKKGIEELIGGSIVPIYPQTENLDTRVIRQIIYNVINDERLVIEETLPTFIREKYGLYSRKEAIKKLHFPENFEEAYRARETLVFEEAFYFFLKINWKKEQALKNAVQLNPKGELTQRFLSSLPFQLTNAQKRVIKDIERDLSSKKPMHRLLQGDVGSGKTIVAIYAMLIAVQNGYQAALMAPTEPLAEQHYIVINDFLKDLNIKTVLLSRSVTKRTREHLLNLVLSGEAQIVIGTHAVIQEDVKFKNLAVAIVDEQHRFGVLQRGKLLEKSENFTPHFLVMTATPIPRTLALTFYGDLNISVLDEKPVNRGKIVTAVRTVGKRNDIYNWLFDKIKEGNKAYIISPIIEKSESLEIKACEEIYRSLLSVAPEHVKIGILHGRLPTDIKRETMLKFRRGEINLLVATTVIEVGIDVPDATIIIIENAERFGIAQLHQLRGRVGRSEKKSYCILIRSEKVTEEAEKRLKALETCNDGFKLAEIDLELRGPGEFLGKKQHGFGGFRILHLSKDREFIEKSKIEALQLLKNKWQIMQIPEIRIHLEKILEGDELYVA